MISYVFSFLNPVADCPNPPPMVIPDECKSLMGRLNELTTFAKFNNPYPMQFIEFREIVLGKSQDGKEQILIKQPPMSKNFLVRSRLAKQEQLAYLISERLGLKVVPAAVAIEGFKEEIDKISETVRKRLITGSGNERYQGVVIQEKINAHFILGHLEKKGVLFRVISWCLSWFQCLFSSLSLNQKQISKAILFNIVAGRTDGHVDNTVIDTNGKVMEIDNEYIGNGKTSSWLFSAFPDHILCKEVIDAFLETDSSIIEDVFKDFERRYPKLPFWNARDEKFNIQDKSKSNILNNFERLQTFLNNNRNSVIKVQDLKQFEMGNLLKWETESLP